MNESVSRNQYCLSLRRNQWVRSTCVDHLFNRDASGPLEQFLVHFFLARLLQQDPPLQGLLSYFLSGQIRLSGTSLSRIAPTLRASSLLRRGGHHRCVTFGVADYHSHTIFRELVI